MTAVLLVPASASAQFAYADVTLQIDPTEYQPGQTVGLWSTLGGTYYGPEDMPVVAWESLLYTVGYNESFLEAYASPGNYQSWTDPSWNIYCWCWPSGWYPEIWYSDYGFDDQIGNLNQHITYIS